MRDVKTSAIGILFLSFVTLGMAQNPGGVPYPSLSSTDMGGDDSGSFGTGVFNFHPYRMFDQPGESWSMPTLGLDEVSAFVVFSRQQSVRWRRRADAFPDCGWFCAD